MFNVNDRILIYTRLKRGDEVREARVSRVNGIFVSFEPAAQAKHPRSGYGQFRTTQIGAKPFGLKTVPAFAVVSHYPVLCPDTDAIMGQGQSVEERHLTKAKAKQRADQLNQEGGDVWFDVQMKPFKKGEAEIKRPMHSALELYYDQMARA